MMTSQTEQKHKDVCEVRQGDCQKRRLARRRGRGGGRGGPYKCVCVHLYLTASKDSGFSGSPTIHFLASAPLASISSLQYLEDFRLVCREGKKICFGR